MPECFMLVVEKDNEASASDIETNDMDPEWTPETTDPLSNITPASKNRRNKSILWEFFVPLSDQHATCNICQCNISYTTTSNLKNHLLRRHPSVHLPALSRKSKPGAHSSPRTVKRLKLEPSSDVAVASLSENESKESVWNYFMRVNDKIANCSICNKSIKHNSSTFNLTKHMDRCHPTVHIPPALSSLASEHSPKRKFNTSSDDGATIPVSNRKKSFLWKYFLPMKNFRAKCKLCYQLVSFKTTSNLKRHLERKHSTINLQEESTRSQEEIPADLDTSFTDARTDTDAADARQQKLINKPKPAHQKSRKHNILLRLFTQDYQPFSIVDGKGFKHYIKSMNPSYVLPSKQFITETLLPEVYEETLVEMRKAVADARSVTVSTECWSSVHNRFIMSVTVHFITGDFKKKTVQLDCASFGEGCTNFDIVEEIRRIIVEWGLESKVLLTVSSSVDSIGRCIKEQLNWDHFDCYAHTLNEIVADGLKLGEPLLEKVRTVISQFRDNLTAAAQLSSIQEQMGNSNSTRLIQDISTRWTSTFYMVERLLELQEAISSATTLLDSEALPPITIKEWQLLADIKKVLQPMESLTEIMNAQDYVCISSVIILTEGLQRVYKQMKNRTTSTAAGNIIQELLKGIQIRLGDLEISETLLVSTFLDPRFKNVGFSNETVAQAAKKTVENLVYAKMGEATTTAPSNIEITVLNDGECDGSSFENAFSVWSYFDEKAMATQPTANAYNRAVEEVQRYLDDDRLERDGDPLAWWSERSYKYPHLKEVVIERLGTTATSVPCEMLFSEAGQELCDRRSQFSFDMVRKLVFLNANRP